MSNIAEGFERGNWAEFRQFLVVAKASCAEVRSQAYVAWDVGYPDNPDFHSLYDLASEVARILGGLKASLQRQRDGQKNRTED